MLSHRQTSCQDLSPKDNYRIVLKGFIGAITKTYVKEDWNLYDGTFKTILYQCDLDSKQSPVKNQIFPKK